MTDKPLVSVYMPTHNRCKILPRAILSVQKQTYQAIELIIVDDGSTDETWHYLSELASTSDKIKVFRHEVALGACAARNLAIQHASGKFVTGLDDDDEFCADRITKLIEQYDPQYSFISTGFLWNYGKRSRSVNHNAMIIDLKSQLNYNYATNQVLVEKSRLLAIGGFDESFVACQDYDTWTRLIKAFGNAKHIAGASYIIHRGDDVPRLTESKNWLKGHAQYMEKHAVLMSEKNKLNQEFRVIVAQRSKMTIKQLFLQLRAGQFYSKLRYFLSSNLQAVAKYRKQFLEK